jgi:hypothetical protein
MSRASGGQPALGNGTPEQVHLTWGDDPATSVVVSWATPGRAVRPRVRIGQRVILAQERSYADATTRNRSALAPYLSRYALPSDGSPGSGGRWYAFRVAAVVFACLDSSDVAYADRSYPNGAQTRWLDQALARARADATVDWIIVSLHHPACCSAPGCDLGVREEWLPLFDAYQVDLVLAGHADGYERSFPCRGHDLSVTRRPRPVATAASSAASSTLDTSQGTVHLALGHAPSEALPPGTARVEMGNGGEVAIEQATWSGWREAAAGPGIAVFDVNPGTEAGGQTSITVSAYRAGGAGPEGPAGVAAVPADDLTEIERITLVRPRSDRQRRPVRDGAEAGRSR